MEPESIGLPLADPAMFGQNLFKLISSFPAEAGPGN